ncbi:hypothetical protein ACS0TY_003064 [Phlomoides rotata]
MDNGFEMITANLPEEIITEILLRLPVKSLLKFRCVSKTWLFLISSYQFAKAHLEISTKNNVYIHDKLIFGSKILPMDLYTCSIYSLIEGSNITDSIYPKTDGILLYDRVQFDCPPAELDDAIWLVGSCNGLVCVSISPNNIYLWNPTTKKSKMLPNSGTDLDFDYYSITFAFGYDELHDDYKVVEFFGAEHETGVYETQLKVYSRRTNSWKILSNWPGGDTFGGSGKFLNGAIHWSVCKFDRPFEWVIVAHDLATDVFIELPLPNLEDDDDVIFEVKILEGGLALYCEHNLYMDAWVMKEYGVGKSWTKVFRIPFFLDFRDHELVRPCPLSFSADGKTLINYGTSLRVYDLSDPQPHQFSSSLEVEATTYIESLVSPNFEDEVIIGRTLPQEIITEIFLRLPVKSLLRFKSVSKGLLSLISSSDFVKAHLRTSTKNNVYIHDKLIFGSKTFDMELYTYPIHSMIESSVSYDPVHAEAGSVYSVTDENLKFNHVWLDCSDIEPDEMTFLVGSCNGLVCVSFSSNSLILWNPTTSKSKMLPDSGTVLDFEHYGISYAFGYDELHDDYKVVEFLGFVGETGIYDIQVKVYSMRTNSWKILSNWPGGDTFGGSGKFLNGAIHWSVCDFDRLANWAIVSYNLSTDTFVELPLPNLGDDVRVEVAIIRGSLAVYCEHNVYMDIWVMKEYGTRESWTKVVRIPFFLDFWDHEFFRPHPLFLSVDGKVLVNYGSSLKIYDSNNPQPHQLSTTWSVAATTYVESLVSPNMYEGNPV